MWQCMVSPLLSTNFGRPLYTPLEFYYLFLRFLYRCYLFLYLKNERRLLSFQVRYIVSALLISSLGALYCLPLRFIAHLCKFVSAAHRSHINETLQTSPSKEAKYIMNSFLITFSIDVLSLFSVKFVN